MEIAAIKSGRTIPPAAILNSVAGTVAIEAAIAFPVLLLFIFSFISVAQLLSVRSLVYEAMVEASRHRGVTELHCGGANVVTDAANDSKTRIVDSLQARGIQMSAADIQVTADQPLPQNVTSWNLSAQFLSQCPACQIFQGIAPIQGFFRVNMAIFPDNKGCI